MSSYADDGNIDIVLKRSTDGGTGDLLIADDYHSSDFSFYSEAILSPAK